MQYIIESSNGGNNRILSRQDDGTYKPIASCFGEAGNSETAIMVALANANVNSGL